MAIYKLGEIIQVISGNSKLTKKYVDANNGEFGVVSSSSFNNGIFGYINTFLYEKGITISKDGSIGNVFWQDKPFSINTGAFLVKPKDLSIINEKYLFFLLKTKEKRLKQIGDGSVIKHIYAKDINNLEAIIPDLKTQNSIIDIIEPHEELFLRHNHLVRIDTIENAEKDIKTLIDIIEPNELIENKIKKMKKNIDKIYFWFFDNFSIRRNNFLYENVSFIKGKNKSKNQNTSCEKNTFINISSLQGKINDFTCDKKNVHFGDILISLDATTGIVNNNIEGFNGYAYKVESKTKKDVEIYLNLINKFNQKIIKNFSVGTTIMHASKAKNKLINFEFNHVQLIEKIYYFDFKLKKIEQKIQKLKNKILKIIF
ncbi:restriction endonuclease subunit S [Mesomycoplasma neurolyticum]|uniref:Restriction modification enzyme subunit S2A n=1 Tax=Mesomycoplasma neurolyticum TaxID=2120 RepID=A0A449A4H6_9BACT|nr:restriction endonuclease subunit S [Mesomycoplasma neurolyticum]VEU59114.1 restriction modification enzyme subunit S2A [Mesomycoplasma neurolyticum]VEU59862.1 restriction modification enzyme subunit S2A [Mesomycoplasma neurolyticum]